MSGSLSSFLKRHEAQIKRASINESQEPQGGSSTLIVVVLAASETQVSIGHLGRIFSIRREDVIDITDAPENTPNLFGYGQAAQIVVKSSASLSYQQIVPVEQLENGQPFASARPTTMPPFTSDIYSPNELAWRQKNRCPATGFTPFATASYASYSASPSTTWSLNYNDDYGNDDSGPDEPGILDD